MGYRGHVLVLMCPQSPPAQCLLIKDIKVTLSLSCSGGPVGYGVWREVSVRGAGLEKFPVSPRAEGLGIVIFPRLLWGPRVTQHTNSGA